MTDVVVTPAEPSKGLWRDYRHYVFWWCFWCGLTSFLQPVADSGGITFGVYKAIQFGTGLVYGVGVAAIFTLLQNTMNQRRRKPLSWVLAIATAIIGYIITFAVAGIWH